MKLHPTLFVWAVLGAGVCACTQAASEPFPLVGQLAPKHIEQAQNDLTIGCETLDRDYAKYDEYKAYLSTLGMRKIRLQAGWAKTEKVKGVYDFAWLDHIIDDAYARGLTIFLETSYGNPIYEGGGTPSLSGGWPSTPEALEAWDNWVRAMATRYKDKVAEWEMWNEPDLNKSQVGDGKSIVDLNIRTAEIIKSINPEAKIAALALARTTNKPLCEAFLQEFQRRGKFHLFEWITYHEYVYRPEDMYPRIDAFREMVAKYSDKIILRQGESGAPSARGFAGALAKYDWNEEAQAKWNLRRILSDKGKGIPTGIFSLSEFIYATGDHLQGKNAKGLLEIDDQMRIVRPKLAYKAMQHVVAIYDLLGPVLPSENVVLDTDKSYSRYYFKCKTAGKESHAFYFWLDGEIPLPTHRPEAIDITVTGAKIRKPVLVDMRSGQVRKISRRQISVDGNKTTYKEIPAYDGPMLIIDGALLTLAGEPII